MAGRSAGGRGNREVAPQAALKSQTYQVVPEPQYYSAEWTAPAQSASGSFDLTFTVNTDKHQQNTLEKVDGAVITITPSQTGGSVDGGSWQMTLPERRLLPPAATHWTTTTI